MINNNGRQRTNFQKHRQPVRSRKQSGQRSSRFCKTRQDSSQKRLPSRLCAKSPAFQATTTCTTRAAIITKTEKKDELATSARRRSRYCESIEDITKLLNSPHGEACQVLARYRSIRLKVPIRHFPHPRQVLDLAIELLPKIPRTSHENISYLIGGNRNSNREAYQYISAQLSEIFKEARLIGLDKVNYLADELSKEFGCIPDTALDDRSAIYFTAPELRTCLRIANFKDRILRITAGRALYILAAGGGSIPSQRLLATAYASVDRAIAETTDLGEDAAEAHASAFAAVISNPRLKLATRDKYRRKWRSSLKIICEHLTEHSSLPVPYANLCLELPKICTKSLLIKKPRNFANAIARIDRYLATAQGSPDRVLAKYRLLRAEIKLTSLPHPQQVVDLATQAMRGQNFTKRAVHKLIGGSHSDVAEVYAELARRLHQVPHVHTGLDYLPDNRLGTWLLQHLTTIPETHLDPLYATMIAGPALRIAIKVFAFKVPAVRLLAGISLYLSAARRLRRSFYQDFAAFRMLDQKLLAAGAENCGAVDDAALLATQVPLVPSIATTHEAFKAILTDDTISPHARAERYKSIVSHMARLDRLCVTYPQFSLQYQPWRIPAPSGVNQNLLKRLTHMAQIEREMRRDASCAPTAMDPGATYRAYETRFREVQIIRNAFDTQCALLSEGAIQLKQGESRFSVTIPSTQADGTLIVGECTLDFAVVTLKSLVRRAPSISLSALGNDSAGALFLEYLGPRDPDVRLRIMEDGTPKLGVCEPPVLAMYRAGCFLPRSRLSSKDLAAREALLPSASWPQNCAAPLSFVFGERAKSRLAGECFRSGIVLLPIHQLHFAFAIGRAIGRSVLRGARIGEVMQQLGDPDAFKPIGTKDDAIWQYQAVAKQKTVAEAFYLSPQDMEAIMDVMRITGRNGWKPGIVKAAPSLQGKCGPAVYLYQRRGVAFSNSELSLPLAIPLWPYSQRAHDLRHGIARNHHHNGISRNKISAFLHHSPMSSTDKGYQSWSLPVDRYTKPVAQMLAELLNLLDAYYNQERPQ